MTKCGGFFVLPSSTDTAWKPPIGAVEQNTPARTAASRSPNEGTLIRRFSPHPVSEERYNWVMTVDEMVGVGLSVALGVITYLVVRQAFK